MRRLLAAGLVAVALAAGSAEAQHRDTLTIGITQFPSTFHPSIENMAAKSYILGLARRPVTTYDADWALTCMLCVRLPTIENGDAMPETAPNGNPGIRVTYRLREDAIWGDGTPVTADDIVFAWEAGREPLTGIGPAELYRSLHRITVIDQRTFTLHFDKLTFAYNAINDLNPLPARLERPSWREDARAYRTRTLYDRETANPGLWNGPYRITAIQTGASVTLERNPAWKGPAPAFRRIVVRTIENTTALEAALLAGQIDMIAGELGLRSTRRSRSRSVPQRGSASTSSLDSSMSTSTSTSKCPRSPISASGAPCLPRSTASRSSIVSSRVGRRWRGASSTRSTG